MQRPAWRTVALAGLLAGAFDITFAFIFYSRQGVNPARILRGIASGVLGSGAFTLGTWTVALGAALHFFIAVCAAFVLPTLHNVIGELFSHIFLFGMVIALGVARASSARGLGAT